MQVDELKCLLSEKIRDAEELLNVYCHNLSLKNINGISKLDRKIRIELENLVKFESNPDQLTIHHLTGSNLNHYKALCKIASVYNNVTSVLSPFRRPDGSVTFVDITADDGSTWVKVVARNAKGLHFSFTGESYSKEKNIISQAIDYVDAAKNNPHHYRTPNIIFEFVAGLTEPIRKKLIKLGIVPKGEVQVVTTSYSDSESTSDDQNTSGEEAEDFTPSIPAELTDQKLSLNLDVTALFAFVSNLTNGHANYRFQSPMLNHQAELERLNPALNFMKECVSGRTLICCQTAFNSFRDILKTVGGLNEQARAADFLKNVNVVDDAVSERVEKLKLGTKIKKRSKIIFSSGDYYEAITLSANKSFVLAAESQNVKLAAILHGSRALSEQKQLNAMPV